MTRPSTQKRSLIGFLKQNMVPVGILIASFVALIYFSWGFIANLIYFADPRHQNQPLEAWMTPRYVVMSWNLPPEIVDDVMGLEPKVEKRKKLSKVVEELGITIDELNTRIAAAKVAHEESLEKKKPKPKEPKPEKE